MRCRPVGLGGPRSLLLQECFLSLDPRYDIRYGDGGDFKAAEKCCLIVFRCLYGMKRRDFSAWCPHKDGQQFRLNWEFAEVISRKGGVKSATSSKYELSCSWNNTTEKEQECSCSITNKQLRNRIDNGEKPSAHVFRQFRSNYSCLSWSKIDDTKRH